MDDQEEGDDAYSDDDLDALPNHAFNELQENAVRLTQQSTSRAFLPPPKHQLRPEHAGVTRRIGGLNVGGIAGQGVEPQLLPPPSSDYGDFDDEMLDGEVLDGGLIDVIDQRQLKPDLDTDVNEGQPGESTQRESWRQQRYSEPQLNLRTAIQPNTAQAVDIALVSHGPRPLVSESRGHHIQAPEQNVDVAALQAQVQKVCYRNHVCKIQWLT